MANPPLDSATITQRGTMVRDDNNVPAGWRSAYITAQTTTLVKTGAGILHSITFNKPTATGTVELDDALTNTGPFAIITTPTAPQPVTLFYDVAFNTGLSITTGTAG